MNAKLEHRFLATLFVVGATSLVASGQVTRSVPGETEAGDSSATAVDNNPAAPSQSGKAGESAAAVPPRPPESTNLVLGPEMMAKPHFLSSSAAPVLLRYRFHPSQTFHTVTYTRFTTETVVEGERRVAGGILELRADYAVKAVTAEGDARFVVTVARGIDRGLRFADPSFDSQQGTTTNEPRFQALAVLVDRPLDVTVSSSGRILDFDLRPLAEEVRHRGGERALAKLVPALDLVLKNAFVRFPEGEVKVGDAYDPGEFRTKLPDGGEARTLLSCRLAAVSGDGLALLETVSRSSYHASGKEQTRVTLEGVEVGGWILVDLEKGNIVRSFRQSESTIALSQGSQTMKLKRTSETSYWCIQDSVMPAEAPKFNTSQEASVSPASPLLGGSAPPAALPTNGPAWSAIGQSVVPLEQAVKDGKVEAKVSGIGGSTGDTILLTIRRTVPQMLRLTLTPGTVFTSVSGTVQNMAGAAVKGEQVGETSYRPTTEILLTDDGSHSYVIEAYCLNFHKANPGPSDRFRIMAVDERAARLLLAGRDKAASMGAIQAALWMRLESLSPERVQARFPVTPQDIEVARSIIGEVAQAANQLPRREREAARAGDTTSVLKPGDTVTVANEGANLMAGNTAIAVLKKGTEMKVLKVTGKWIGAAVDVKGDHKIGWVNIRDLKRVSAQTAEKRGNAAIYTMRVEPPTARVSVKTGTAQIDGSGTTRTLTVPDPDGQAKVTVLATLDGYQSLEQEILPQPRESRQLAIKLKPSPAHSSVAPQSAAGPASPPPVPPTTQPAEKQSPISPKPEDAKKIVTLTVDKPVRLTLKPNEERPLDIPIGTYVLTVSTLSKQPVLIAVAQHILGAEAGDNIDLVVERKARDEDPLIVSCKHGSVYGFWAPGMGKSGPPRAALVNAIDETTSEFTLVIHLAQQPEPTPSAALGMIDQTKNLADRVSSPAKAGEKTCTEGVFTFTVPPNLKKIQGAKADSLKMQMMQGGRELAEASRTADPSLFTVSTLTFFAAYESAADDILFALVGDKVPVDMNRDEMFNTNSERIRWGKNSGQLSSDSKGVSKLDIDGVPSLLMDVVSPNGERLQTYTFFVPDYPKHSLAIAFKTPKSQHQATIDGILKSLKIARAGQHSRK